jgi:magnesium transporter
MATDANLPPPPTTDGGIINCAAYQDGVRSADIDISGARGAVEAGHFVWIGLYEPSEELLQQVQQAFGLHELAIEDAHRAHQRPKLEQYQDSLFVVLQTAQLTGEPPSIELGETHVFVGPSYIVTVRHGSLRSHVGLRARCEATPQLLAKGAGFVLYALVDFVVDQYLPVVEQLEGVFEDLEEEIFGGASGRDTTARIYRLKRELLTLKRAVSPLIDVCGRLMRFDIDLLPPDTRPYFRDVLDHVLRVNERIDNLRELLTTALEANLALISMSQNEDTKRLAGWAAIIAVPTMIAGIYGMNFRQMPELRWAFGYPVALGVMAVLCVGLYAGFKRSGWL